MLVGRHHARRERVHALFVLMFMTVLGVAKAGA